MAAITPEKLRELMSKVRKGATTSFSFIQIGAILEAIGGKLEPVNTIVHLEDKPGGPDPHLKMDWSLTYADSPEEAQTVLTHLKKYEVKALPAKPKPGLFFAMDVQDPEERPGGGGKPYYSIAFHAYYSTIGYRVELAGKSATILPGRYDLPDVRWMAKDGPPKHKRGLREHEVLVWLSKETDWVARCNKYNNVEEHIPAEARSRDRTGSCPICFSNVKLSGGREIVLHGYQRPGYGFIQGSCYGVGYEPFEVSVKGVSDYLTQKLEPGLKAAEKRLASLQSGKIETIIYRKKVIKPGDSEWDRVLASTIDTCEREIKDIAHEIKSFEKLRSNWKERPLPKEGDRHINWFLEGQKTASVERVANAFLLPKKVVGRYLASRVANRFVSATTGWETVNSRTLEESEMDSIWEQFVATYKKLGLTHSSIAAMMSEYDVWEVFREGFAILAFAVSKRTPFGIKLGLLGSDGTPAGKTALKSFLSTNYKRSGHYGEVSHGVEHVALKANAPVVCATNVGGVIKKKIDPLPDGVHYVRNLTGIGMVTKILIGIPRGVPTTDANHPRCSVGDGEARVAFDEDETENLDSHYACQIDLE